MLILDPVTKTHRQKIEATFGHYEGDVLVAIQPVITGLKAAVCQVNGEMVKPVLMLEDVPDGVMAESTGIRAEDLKTQLTPTIKASRRGRRFLRKQLT